jgi:AcrR family transcriptional regulator
MPRPKSIDRQAILKAAEELITETGGMHFTMDMVAARAGISKGGLTYSFATKDALIAVMLERELSRFVAEREATAASDSPQDRLQAHIRASGSERDVFVTRAAHLMAAVSNAPAHLETVQRFYREVFDLADPATEAGRRARQAFLAIEGLFLLRSLGLLVVSDAEWQDVFAQALKDF